MSGSRWVITPSWLSGLWRSFFYSSSVYSCHLFLTSSASVRSMPFLSFIELIFVWNAPLVSPIFLKRPLVFPFCCFPLFFCTDHWGRLSYLSLLLFGTLHSNGYTFPFLLCFSLLFFSQLFVRPPQTAISVIANTLFQQHQKTLHMDQEEKQMANEKRKDIPILMQSSKE